MNMEDSSACIEAVRVEQIDVTLVVNAPPCSRLSLLDAAAALDNDRGEPQVTPDPSGGSSLLTLRDGTSHGSIEELHIGVGVCGRGYTLWRMQGIVHYREFGGVVDGVQGPHTR